jgi:hypothetical protein
MSGKEDRFSAFPKMKEDWVTQGENKADGSQKREAWDSKA